MASPYTQTKWGPAGQGQSGGVVSWSFAATAGTIVGFDAVIQSPAFQNAIRGAFDVWEGIANIDFREVADSVSANIRMGFDAIDGRGQTLAVAHWQYSGAQTQHAEIAFDSAEAWSAPASTGTDFFAVAVHEIGHAIGLAHSDLPASIMYAYLQGNYAGLAPSDVQAIQGLYGRAAPIATVLSGSGIAETLTGGAGDDVITGGGGSDVLAGGGGADRIGSILNAGDIVTVFGGRAMSDPSDGADRIEISGAGGAEIYGNGGADQIVFTGSGKGVVFGGAGDDRIEIANHAANVVYGGSADADVISITGNGDNLVFGGASASDPADGSDTITISGNGANTVYANAGNDTVTITGTGRATVYGGLGDDRITTGDGADRLAGGPGANVLTGGRSSDVFVHSLGGRDVITDFRVSEGDRLDLQGQGYTIATASDGSAAFVFADGGVIVLHGVTAADVSGAFLA